MNGSTVHNGNGALPVLLSIPHCGLEVPPVIRPCLAVDEGDIQRDSDMFTDQLYAGDTDAMRAVVRASTARLIVDVNRPRDAIPPKRKFGVIKRRTSTNKPVFQDDKWPSSEIIEQLLRTHYDPFHSALRQSLRRSAQQLLLGLDCHSMAAKGPKASMDAGKARPLICVGNRRGETCPDDWLEIFAEELRIAYQFEEDEVTVNRPFRGGYITHAYGGNPIPWLQIEINRSLYLSREWFDKEKGEVQPGRMKELNGRFLDALGRLIQRIQ